MSGWTDLQPVTWQGLTFHIERVETEVRRRVVEDEYPDRDGADVSDLGRRPLNLRFSALLKGTDYRDQARRLMAACDLGESGPLVHPYHGTIVCHLRGYREVAEHTRTNFLSVDLDFVEDQVDRLAFDVTTDTDDSLWAGCDAAADAADEALEALA